MSQTFARRDSAVRRLASSGGARARYGLGLRQDLRPLLPVLIPVVVAGAALVVAAAISFVLDHPSGSELAGVAALLAASITAEAFPVPIEGVAAGRTSLATIFIVGVAVEYGWAPAALVGFLTMFVIEAARRRGPARVAYNASMYTLAAGAAGLAPSLSPGDDLFSLSVAA